MDYAAKQTKDAVLRALDGIRAVFPLNPVQYGHLMMMRAGEATDTAAEYARRCNPNAGWVQERYVFHTVSHTGYILDIEAVAAVLVHARVNIEALPGRISSVPSDENQRRRLGKAGATPIIPEDEVEPDHTSSKEIAARFDLKHSDVRNAMRREMTRAGVDPKAHDRPYSSQGKRVLMMMYHVPYELARNVIDRYSGAKAARANKKVLGTQKAPSPKTRKRRKTVLPDFENPAASARAWADQYEQRQAAEALVSQRSEDCPHRTGRN